MMPGMGRMNPRMMKKLQKQLQNSTEEIDATEVIIRTKEKELYFSNPSVSAMNLMGQQTYQIVGEPQERGLDGEDENTSIPNEDIELVASQAGVSQEKAKAALECDSDDMRCPAAMFPMYSAAMSLLIIPASLIAASPVSSPNSRSDLSHNSPNLVIPIPITLTSLNLNPPFSIFLYILHMWHSLQSSSLKSYPLQFHCGPFFLYFLLQ